MLDSIRSLLDTFPEGVVQAREGAVLEANAMARHYLPLLVPGAPVPEQLVLPQAGAMGAGTFSAGPARYTYSCTSTGGEELILFRPAPQTALTGRQMDGTLYQLRALLGEILAEVGPATASPQEPVDAGAFAKSFHRLFRLVGNLEYLQEAAEGDGLLFRTVTMDLEDLCRQTVAQARPLLQEAGIALELESTGRSLLIPGDPELLRRLLLGLIANAAQAAGEGRITLALRRRGERALTALSDNGPLPDQRRLAALFQEGRGQDLPLPGQGAGLGLTIARHIVALHGGTMLTEWGRSAPSVVISLPTGPLDGRTRVRTPAVPVDGGLDPVLVELSDVLPDALFGMEPMD